jgi:antitoxin MazE
MRAKAQKWGNSLAVRIPKAVADQVGVHAEDELEVEVVARVIRLKPCRGRLTLDRLLRGVTPENLHGEADFGKPRGREAW